MKKQSARDLIASQEAQAPFVDPIDPKLRAAAKLHRETGALVINHNLAQPEPQPTDELVYEPVAATVMDPEPILDAPVVEASKKSSYRPTVTIEIMDGRKLRLAPPEVAFEMLIPSIIKNKDWNALEMEVNLQTARTLQYLQSINGQPINQPLRTWDECATVVHRLKALGYQSLRDACDTYWPLSGPRLWAEAKN